jgi:hypothetical protein
MESFSVMRLLNRIPEELEGTFSKRVVGRVHAKSENRNQPTRKARNFAIITSLKSKKRQIRERR